MYTYTYIHTLPALGTECFSCSINSKFELLSIFTQQEWVGYLIKPSK